MAILEMHDASYVHSQNDHLQRMKIDYVKNKEYYDEIARKRYAEQFLILEKYIDKGFFLDVGCGMAKVLFEEFVKPSKFDYYCTDIAQEVVDYMNEFTKMQGNEKYSRLGIIQEIPFQENTFDVIYASHILEHSTDIAKAFSEIKRVLKPEGVLLFAVPCGYDDEPAHVYNREYVEWIEDFQNNNFVILESGRHDYLSNEFYGIAKPKT